MRFKPFWEVFTFTIVFILPWTQHKLNQPNLRATFRADRFAPCRIIYLTHFASFLPCTSGKPLPLAPTSYIVSSVASRSLKNHEGAFHRNFCRSRPLCISEKLALNFMHFLRFFGCRDFVKSVHFYIHSYFYLPVRGVYIHISTGGGEGGMGSSCYLYAVYILSILYIYYINTTPLPYT